MAKILILNGAARKNGSTAALIKAFRSGAERAGNEVVEFYLQNMTIHGCMGCNGCAKAPKDKENPCVQKDEMAQINEAFAGADVVAFASPVYFWTITGPLKTVVDRLYGQLKRLGYGGFPRKSVLLMTAGSTDYSQVTRWYETFEHNLGWTNLGKVLGGGKTREAEKLGESIR